jgi:hypothetical protein
LPQLRFARDFVDGKRKRHIGPWVFLIITVGLASAVILMSGVHWFEPFGHGKAGEVLQRHVNLVILMQVPGLLLRIRGFAVLFRQSLFILFKGGRCCAAEPGDHGGVGHGLSRLVGAALAPRPRKK